MSWALHYQRVGVGRLTLTRRESQSTHRFVVKKNNGLAASFAFVMSSHFTQLYYLRSLLVLHKVLC